MDDINEKLNQLSPEERKIALEILKEYKESGKSDLFDSLKYADYDEIPVDIETFLKDSRYLGNAWHDAEGNFKMYPYWLNRLKELFPDNTTTKVNTFIASGARGLGKSEIAVAVMCYMLYRVMCLKNPMQHFHLKPTEKIVFALMNIKLELAEEIATSKFQNSIKESPWFMQRGSLTGRTTLVWQPDARYHIDIKIGSQADDLIGLPIYFAFFDEISFVRNMDIDKQKKKAIDMIDTALGGMLTRFIHNGQNPTLLYLASSKRSDKSFLEEHIKTKMKNDAQNVIIVDEAVWKVKPEGTYSKETFNLAVGNKFLVSQVLKDDDDPNEFIKKGYTIIHPPVTLRTQFLDDMDRALCDYAGISSTELSKYISGAAVNDCLNPNRQNPFSKDIIEVGNGKDDKAEYKDFFDLTKVDKSMMQKPLCIHLDMSISGDMTGIAGVWIKGKKPSTDINKQEKDLFFELAFSVSIKAPKGRQVSFEKNRNFIRWLRSVGFNVKEVTTDTFQSYDLRQQLEAEGYKVNVLSVDRVAPNTHVCVPYQFFKNVIYEQRVDMYESNTLIEEIVNLERNINTGKVDHPENFRKDVCDAFCGAMFTASQYAEEYAYDYGESYDILIGANTQSNMTNAVFKPEREMTVDFNEELKKAYNPIPAKPAEPEISQPTLMGDILIW